MLRMVFRAALAAVRPILTAIRTALRPRRAHLLQRLHLISRQYLLELCLHFGLQARYLLLLIGGQLQFFLGARR